MIKTEINLISRVVFTSSYSSSRILQLGHSPKSIDKEVKEKTKSKST